MTTLAPEATAAESSGTRPLPDDGTLPVTHDVACLQDLIVNVIFVGYPGDRWVLIDAGMAYTAASIENAAERRYGRGRAPEAITLTHARFDHVGALATLAEKWEVLVYAHQLELP